ncbi:unnamed protein product [Ranitomeya imitator]|uniref:Pre-PUA domain-containing protein n=1 Tax=Ranitomeya imitator TaxID=111125 RepID=A0ABN9LKX2_9NEOB|nr:unnamed protein product [Ranitomeya imitator]
MLAAEAKPQIPDPGRRFSNLIRYRTASLASKRKYPFSDEELNIWTKIPKVDAAVASTSKQSALPVEDAGLLSDPLDRKAESSLKRFDEKENVSNCIQLKTSVIKGIKNQLNDQFPGIDQWLNQIMPKKDPVKIVRCHEHIEILTVNGELLFFRQREGPFYPTLRLLHKYLHLELVTQHRTTDQSKAVLTRGSAGPELLRKTVKTSEDPFILPHQQVDKGAIKFVLSGANIMCPGLTSPGAKLYPAALDKVVDGNQGKHRVTKRGPALSYPMFTLVTGIVGHWRAVCVTALQRPNSDAAAIRIVVGIAAASLCVTGP